MTSNKQNYRTILPAVPTAGAPTTSTSAETNGPIRKPQSLSSSKSNVIQACLACRKSKIKCTGTRPKCRKCSSKNLDCIYSDFAKSDVALKERLETLERLVSDLRLQPADKAHQLLDSVRSQDADVEHLVLPVASPSSSDVSPDAHTPERFSLAVAPHTDPGVLQGASDTQDNEMGHPDGSNEQRPQQTVLLMPHVQLRLPSVEITLKAVEYFYSSSGDLFQLFSREEVDRHAEEVYSGRGNCTISLVTVSAVAAIGTQYQHEFFDQADTDAFYSIARYYLETVLEKNPLHATKICCLLAMYNTLDKGIVALGYVEIGLAMCKRQGLDTSTAKPPYDMSLAQWTSYRRTWRTLMFFWSWLSFTLGYISANDILFCHTPLSDLDLDEAPSFADVVQAELSKVALLKAEILRMQLSFKELTPPAVESIVRDLQRWYSQLPSTLQIAHVAEANLPQSVTVSICHVHLLHLGAILLLYRRITSQFACIYGFKEGQRIVWRPFDKDLLRHLDAGILAAKHSARILKFMIDRNVIFRRCWLVIFQSYAACVTLLYDIIRKQINKFPATEWAEELGKASDCLSILKYCGHTDPVARQFHEKLEPIFERVEIEPTQMNDESIVTLVDTELRTKYMVEIPADITPQHLALVVELAIMVCQPFGEQEQVSRAELNIKENWRTCPWRFSHAQLVEHLAWDFESTLPFQWDKHIIFGSQNGAPENGLAGGHFLASTNPHLWYSP